MNTELTPEIKEVMEAVLYRPAISILLPFNPKMQRKEQLVQSLERITTQVETELSENYPQDICLLVTTRLRNLLRKIDFNTYKKSIAIYISPVFEKLLYLETELEEKLMIDGSFEIRDLLYNKKQLRKFLVLMPGNSEIRIFEGDVTALTPIVYQKLENSWHDEHMPERVANFSDPSERREIIMHKHLHHIDDILETILNSYPFPLFVMGESRMLGHFKKLTRHERKVAKYIQGNYEQLNIPDLQKKLEPHIRDWDQVLQKDLLRQVEEAAGRQKLTAGIRNVWKEASRHKGRTLVVEKNFRYMAEHGSVDEIIYKAVEPYNKFSYIKDAVDDVIGKVLENGGNVEFIDDGMLAGYGHIVLIQYY